MTAVTGRVDVPHGVDQAHRRLAAIRDRNARNHLQKPPKQGVAGPGCAWLLSRTRSVGASIASLLRLQHSHRDRATGLPLVLRDLGGLDQDGVAPHGVARPPAAREAARRLSRQDLDLSRGGVTQVLHPVGVTARPRAGAPDDKSCRRLEVTDTGRARDPGSATRGRDHQDVDVLAATGEPSVQASVHPHADAVADARPTSLLTGHHLAPEATLLRRRYRHSKASCQPDGRTLSATTAALQDVIRSGRSSNQNV